jgi:hypothetical protein
MTYVLVLFVRRYFAAHFVHIPPSLHPSPSPSTLQAQRVLIEENDWMFRNRGCLPLSMFSGLRWTEASSCPLSHVYGKPGEKFALMECIATQGTDGTFS